MKHDMLGLKELIRSNVRIYADRSSIKDIGELRSAFLKATEMVFDDLEEELKTFGAPAERGGIFEEKRKQFPKAYEKWTREEEEEITRLHGQGVSVSAIAKQLGRNDGSIRSRLKKLELL